jgi:thiamine-monophosphate kinase
VVTTDAIVAGVHFLPDDPPCQVARKALRVNLSDLAAKGAAPLAYTLTLALGRAVSDSWVEQFAVGLAADQAEFGIALAGGDSVSTPGPILVSITAFGQVPTGRMVRRSGARPGDRVFITGTIGDAALGLAVLEGTLTVAAEDRQFLAGRYRLPQPRNDFAAALLAHAHGALDVSDGLAADFGHLCRESAVDGTIVAADVPLSPAARNAVAADPARWKDILAGGDDYEILLTAAPESGPALRAAARSIGLPLTEIGFVHAGDGRATLADAAGCPIVLAKPGWTHA